MANIIHSTCSLPFNLPSLPFSLPLPMPTPFSSTVPVNRRVLIHGGSGSVGLLLFQWLQQLEYEPTISCKTTDVSWINTLTTNFINTDTTPYDSSNDYGTIIDCVGNFDTIELLSDGGHLLTLRGQLVHNMDQHGIVGGLMYR
jgi:NADPH:quinone reductase-like Zn-dependent oxidoreductase